jgi:hypothetical protein
MAITVENTPQTPTPVFNPVVWVLSSDNVSECEFRYVCDIYVNSAMITRLKTFPNADGYGIFDVSGVLQSFMSEAPVQGLGLSFHSLNTHWVDYQLKFGEEYDNASPCTGSTTVYPDLVTTSTNTVFFGGLHPHDFIEYADTDISDSTSSARCLTNMPSTSKVFNYQFLSVYNTISNKAAKIRVRTYDDAGSVIQTAVILNTTYASNTNRIVSANVGIDALNNATLDSGVQPVIDEDVYSYDVTFLNSGNVQTSELKTFTIDRRCTKYTGRDIVFLNRWGGWDVISFTANMEERVTVSERKEFTRLLGNYTAGSPSGSWGYNYSDMGRVNYLVNANEKRTYYSNWVDEDTANWMRELFTSPAVYEVHQRTGKVSVTHLNPIIVTATEYERYFNRNKKMKQYVLQVDSAYNEVIQRL